MNKYLGNAYHDHQKQMQREDGVRRTEDVWDSFLTAGCWVGVGLIALVLVLWSALP
jgi:hypothetical protein